MYPEDYAAFPGYDSDPEARKWNLWGYIDARDGAQAVRLALAYPVPGREVFVIANADTVSDRPNAELLDAAFPDVERRARSACTTPCSRSTRLAGSSASNRSTAGANTCNAKG